MLPNDVDQDRWNVRLAVDPDACEAGWVMLVPFDELRLERFPMDCQSTEVEAADPHRGESGCYLVPAVNLTKESEHYDGVGLLLWLLEERRYGTWDSSHQVITMFAADVTWTDIAADPARFINAQWVGMYVDSAKVETLEPWHRYPRVPTAFHEPQPI